MAAARENRPEKELTDDESSSAQAGQPEGRTDEVSNAEYATRGQKSTDRKTGLAQSEEHYSWRQVYRACGVDGVGHE